MVEAKVSGIAWDTFRKMPVVFLKEIDGDRILPIWIGPTEALAIAIGLEHMESERPLTHDLINSVIEALSVSVTKIVINDIRNNTYYARIYLKGKNSVAEIDARPSDSIAIAVRTSSPIYIADKVLEKGSTFTHDNKDDLRSHFQNLKPEDFGKFKL